MKKWTLRYAVIVAMALSGLGAEEASAQCQYSISAVIEAPFDCGVLGAASTEVTTMNDLGVVTGTYNCVAGAPRPFMWSEEMGFVAIPLPEGMTFAIPEDINNNSELVGQMGDGGPSRAFHYHDGVWTDLGVLPGAIHMGANAISDAGVIVGDATNGLTGLRIAFIWQDNAAVPIDLPLGPDSSAADINLTSTVVGYMGEGGSTDTLGFAWNRKFLFEIQPLAGSTYSEARGLNQHGVIVGASRFPMAKGPTEVRSWVFEANSLIDLGILPGTSSTSASEINSAMQAIGTSFGGGLVPFLWQSDELYDLRELVDNPYPDLRLRRVVSIADDGRLLVHAHDNAISRSVGVLLTPIGRTLGDVNIDCVVDERDLIDVLDDWGPEGGKEGHLTDIVTSATFKPPGDGRVDGADLAVVLGNWTIRSSQSESERGQQ